MRALIPAAIAAALLSGRCEASGLSLQFEGGVTDTAHPTDCTYADRHEPGYDGNTKFLSGAGGAALRWDAARWVYTGGWRYLGSQSINGAPVIPDVDYAPCGVGGHKKAPKPALWDSHGSERQLYATVGRRISALGGDLVPTVGLGLNTIDWRMTAPSEHDSGPQHHPEPVVGMDYERGRFGVGLYLVGTKPYTESNVDRYFPGQGALAAYARITYRIGK